ncbi:hypothetical protein GCM10011273_18660 [Asticcacaulis endophyticus]|uniref:Uncharacterized protein n=1 Tax=Asticcacaulis endophyticus TaxID=1395890 RepID=A0A918Q6K7_9CAUL|nr:hypothetical protein GCM10011273_18660 [Asticcacaulis endophyticus]
MTNFNCTFPPFRKRGKALLLCSAVTLAVAAVALPVGAQDSPVQAAPQQKTHSLDIPSQSLPKALARLTDRGQGRNRGDLAGS